MHDNQHDNQKFIDDARARGEDTFMYMDPKSGECLLVSGSADSIRLLGEIVDDYEMVCEGVEGAMEEMDRVRGVMPGTDVLNGEVQHAD